MVDPQLLLLGAVFIAGSIWFITSKKGGRDVVLDRLRFHRRRFSGAKTPPRSLSPGKKFFDSVNDFASVYPPSRKTALANVLGSPEMLGNNQEGLKACAGTKECVPLTTELHHAKKTMFLPCGFTVADINALGDFPDYATLSGIPLPEPYLDFDITKAKPRPYRPFRWAYHQTMCECNVRSQTIPC